jgi:hypothetical protein
MTMSSDEALSRAMKLPRLATWPLMAALLVNSLGPTTVNARQTLSVLVGPTWIRVSDLAEELHFETRNDLAERVGSTVRVKVEAVDGRGRKVWAAPPETSSFVCCRWWCVNATALTIDRPDSLSWSLSP